LGVFAVAISNLLHQKKLSSLTQNFFSLFAYLIGKYTLLAVLLGLFLAENLNILPILMRLIYLVGALY
jgi:hypothetical protein